MDSANVLSVLLRGVTVDQWRHWWSAKKWEYGDKAIGELTDLLFSEMPAHLPGQSFDFFEVHEMLIANRGPDLGAIAARAADLSETDQRCEAACCAVILHGVVAGPCYNFCESYITALFVACAASLGAAERIAALGFVADLQQQITDPDVPGQFDLAVCALATLVAGAAGTVALSHVREVVDDGLTLQSQPGPGFDSVGGNPRHGVAWRRCWETVSAAGQELPSLLRDIREQLSR